MQRELLHLVFLNYLVKHEINEDTLKLQLKKIKNELFDQYKTNKIIQSPLNKYQACIYNYSL